MGWNWRAKARWRATSSGTWTKWVAVSVPINTNMCVCVCVRASVPLRPAGRPNWAVSYVDHEHEQESPFPPFPHFHLPAQSSMETLNFCPGWKPALTSWRSHPGGATALPDPSIPPHREAPAVGCLSCLGTSQDHPGQCWARTRLPGPPQARGQDQEVDVVDGKRVWEAAVGRRGFLEGTGGGHQKPCWAPEAPVKGDGGGTPWTRRFWPSPCFFLHLPWCPGFSWDRINSLLSSWYSAVFWI